MLKTLLPSVILLALIFVPIFITVATVMLHKRWEARSERRSPISEKLLHQAGAQARKRVDALGDDMTARLMLLTLIGPIAMLVILLPSCWKKY